MRAEPEQLAIRRGERSHLVMAVAVHSTVLGPALGGCRMWQYGAAEDAVADVLALSRAMTLKAVAAGLALGGGKGVIALPASRSLTAERRRAALLDFGDLVESLQGAYVTAEDVGTSSDDIAVVAERTAHVVGLATARGGSGDPSPHTARGVEAAMRACAAWRWGSRDLRGRRVTVLGCGHVGSALVERLDRAGAEVLASDLDPARAALAERAGARWEPDPQRALLAEADVLAPCALGGVLTAERVAALRCAVVCGGANNQLAGDGVADTLAARGVLYAPDFVVNAGGLISVAAERLGGGPGAVARRIAAIEGTTTAILADAQAEGITPLAAALRRARRRLAAAPRTARRERRAMGRGDERGAGALAKTTTP
jgi:leucine dehydrogenase